MLFKQTNMINIKEYIHYFNTVSDKGIAQSRNSEKILNHHYVMLQGKNSFEAKLKFNSKVLHMD